MTKLVAIFKTSEGKRHSWSYANPDTTKQPSEVKGLLERFAGLKLFKKDNVVLFDTVESAEYVETIETPIF